MLKNEIVFAAVSDYYRSKLAAFGVSPQGVDWNGLESQFRRFEQFDRLLRGGSDSVRVADIGCGYGAYLEYLRSHYGSVEYEGVDICEEMIASASQKFAAIEGASFTLGAVPKREADYCIASGVFNVKLTNSETDWLDYIWQTLEKINAFSRRGFGFNCLTTYSDHDKRRSNLFYAEPLSIFDGCKKKFSNNVCLLHDYGLYEFTILVKK